MKLTALLLALPLVIGSGAVMAADSTTTTESSSTNSGMPTSTESKTKVEHHDGLFGDKSVEKNKTSTQNADGTVSTGRLMESHLSTLVDPEPGPIGRLMTPEQFWDLTERVCKSSLPSRTKYYHAARGKGLNCRWTE
jgi:hypothetical protein